LTFACNRIENSTKNIALNLLNSNIGKLIDSSLLKIDDKIAFDEKGCKVLDFVEQKTENIVDKIDTYYNQGKDVVEEKKEMILDLYSKGKSLIDEKKENLTETGNKIIDTGMVYLEKGKDIVDGQKEFVKDIYHSGVEKAKKAVNEKKDNLKKKGQDVVDNTKEKMVVIYKDNKEKYYDAYLAGYVSAIEQRLQQNPFYLKLDEYYHVGQEKFYDNKEYLNEQYEKLCDFCKEKSKDAMERRQGLVSYADDKKKAIRDRVNYYSEKLENEKTLIRKRGHAYKDSVNEKGHQYYDTGKEVATNLLEKGKDEAHALYEKGSEIVVTTKENARDSGLKILKKYKDTYEDYKYKFYENTHALYHLLVGNGKSSE